MQPYSVYSVMLELDEMRKEHERRAYNILDLFADMGGVFEIFVFFAGMLLFPLSEYSFKLRAIETLFLAKTKDSSMFRSKKPKKKGKGVKLEMVEHQDHFPVKLTVWARIRAYLLPITPICKVLCWKDKVTNSVRLRNLIRNGSKRIDRSL